MLKREITAIDNSSAANPTKVLKIKNARRISALFTRANHSAGSGVFKIQGSIDGSTYIDLPLVALAANTNTQTLQRDLSVTLSANGSEMRVIEEMFISALTHIKVDVTRNTDGNHTVKLVIEDELED